MEVDQIAEGLWRWTTRHPDWTPDEGGLEGWEPDVGCVYYEGPEAVVLIDPLVPQDPIERERFLSALDRDVERTGRSLAILITVHWHGRSSDELAKRYDAALWTKDSGGNPPAGVEPFFAHRQDEVLLWISEHQALVAGDVLLGAGTGDVRVCPDSWLPEGTTPEELKASLRPLLELPIERILVSHGEPILAEGREALARALQAPSAA